MGRSARTQPDKVAHSMRQLANLTRPSATKDLVKVFVKFFLVLKTHEDRRWL